MSTPRPILDITVRCKSLTAHDTVPPSKNARLQLGEVPTDYMDLSTRGNLSGEIVPGKTYRVLIEEVAS